MVCFIINVYDEPKQQVVDVVYILKCLYENCDILLLYDGAKKHNIGGILEFELPRVKTMENGCLWTHRYLQFFLEHSTKKYCIKIDPDTTPLRKFSDFPPTDCIFSKFIEMPLRLSYKMNVPHGGALGFTRGMAEKLVSSGILLLEKFKNSLFYRNMNDFMLSDIIRDNGLHTYDVKSFECSYLET